MTQNENTVAYMWISEIQKATYILQKTVKKSFFVFQNMKPVLPCSKETMIFLLFPTPGYSEKKKI